MTKKELEILSAVQRCNYFMTDNCKEVGNNELADSYITERVAINKFMKSIGYVWDYKEDVFKKEGNEND